MTDKSKAEPGWYEDPADAAQERYWTGTEWLSRVQAISPEPSRGMSPNGYLGYGLALLVIGGAALGADGSSLNNPGAVDLLGLLIAAVGSTLWAIGLVAKGVQVGRRG